MDSVRICWLKPIRVFSALFSLRWCRRIKPWLLRKFYLCAPSLYRVRRLRLNNLNRSKSKVNVCFSDRRLISPSRETGRHCLINAQFRHPLRRRRRRQFVSAIPTISYVHIILLIKQKFRSREFSNWTILRNKPVAAMAESSSSSCSNNGSVAAATRISIIHLEHVCMSQFGCNAMNCTSPYTQQHNDQ